jgi:hypothetical protein
LLKCRIKAANDLFIFFHNYLFYMTTESLNLIFKLKAI